ncbi:Hypothetical predicted protein [Paramuricea clavata]|uniref:Uncharacterized protein n=1 Tax=Paramuricea clavata TaxID=317549 RepID=A0A7D9ELM2_PARCT|nr:Hypothetical predicted protein [Paramuricea clavata]
MADKKRKNQRSMEAFLVKKNERRSRGRDLQIMPGIEASAFAEPLGCTATTPALPPLNDSELEVATDSETGSSSTNSAQKITLETQDGPRQPRLHKFAVRDPKSKKTKSFQASWYSHFDWLENSLEGDAAFCYPCRKFSVNTSAVATSALTFTETGYKNWVNALDANKGLSKHEHSETHKNCCDKWSDLKKIEAGKEKDIRSRINPDREEVARGNREYLGSLFKYVIWFTTNEVPMRGGDETEESKNPGKWIRLYQTAA